jgi:hypothetical protein
MILAVFVVLAVIGQALNVALCLALDKIFSPGIGALAFVLLYMGVFAIAWMIALRIVEGRQRKQITQSAQPHSAEPRSAEPRYATHTG